MKKLLSFFLLVSTLSQASSIIHQSMNYVDPESKVVVAHTISGMKNIEMEKLTSDYWSFLKTQEGDDDLFYYYLIWLLYKVLSYYKWLKKN